VAAFRTGKIVRIGDISQDSRQWPEFQEVAARHGVRAVASIPMRLGEQSVGALNLYDDRPRDWEQEDMNAAVVMADMATSYLLNASKHRQQVELSAQLQHALDHRLVIEQAKGMLAARHTITPEEAFERIRRHARNRGATVHAVADAVVNLGMDL
jgi:GAF domain-containing protein